MPKSVFIKIEVNGLFGADGKDGENYTKFSTVIVSRDRRFT